VVVGAFIAAFASPVPQRDDIDFLQISALFRRSNSWNDVLTSKDLWASWNGHRQLIPRLLASGLLRIGHGDFRVLMAASLVIALLTIPAVLRILPPTVPHRRSIATLTVFALSQSENWLWGYQLAWFIVNFGVLWALALAVRAYAPTSPTLRPGRKATLLFGAALSCTVATLSSAHGVLSWFAVACVCALPGHRRTPFGWVIVGVVGVLVVRSDDWTTRPSPLRVATVSMQLVGCVLKLPAAWIRRDLPGGAGVPLGIGVGLTVVLGAVTIFVLRVGGSQRMHAAGLLGLQLYVIGFIVMVSSARSAPSYETPAQSRYSTVTLLGLLCLIALSAHARSGATSLLANATRRSRLLSPLGISVLGCVVLIGVSASALPSVRGWLSSVDVIERCVNEWKPGTAAKPDCKYTWNATLNDEWNALKAA
jgi:succinate dehydrogenase hydrophobic anchor subunit